MMKSRTIKFLTGDNDISNDDRFTFKVELKLNLNGPFGFVPITN